MGIIYLGGQLVWTGHIVCQHTGRTEQQGETSGVQDDEYVTLTFEPGCLGIDIDDSGALKQVHRFGQAAYAGVGVNWRLHRVNGDSWSRKLLRTCVNGYEPFEVSFIKPVRHAVGSRSVEQGIVQFDDLSGQSIKLVRKGSAVHAWLNGNHCDQDVGDDGPATYCPWSRRYWICGQEGVVPETAHNRVEDFFDVLHLIKAAAYSGHFSHPIFGSRDFEIHIREDADARGGQWTALGQIESINIDRQGNRIVMCDIGGSTCFDGIIRPSGIIKGTVTRYGTGGGKFVLISPGAPGYYKIVRPGTCVTALPSFSNPLVLANLNSGTFVTVQQILHMPEQHRVRGRVEEFDGWITILDTASDQEFATKVGEKHALTSETGLSLVDAFEVFFATTLGTKKQPVHRLDSTGLREFDSQVTRCFRMRPQTACSLKDTLAQCSLLCVWIPPEFNTAGWEDVWTQKQQDVFVCVSTVDSSMAAMQALAFETSFWFDLLRFPCSPLPSELMREAKAAQALDQSFRDILETLDLAPLDMQDLIKRGLTPQQISNASFKTWPGGSLWVPYMVSRTAPPRKKYVAMKAALLIPARSANGLIIALHSKPHEPEPLKYMWVCKDRSFKLPQGDWDEEDPLFCYSVADRSPGTVALIEGGLKAFVFFHLAMHFGFATHVIGAAGAQFDKSEEGLTCALACLQAEEVILYPHAGAVENVNVLLTYFRTFTFLITTLGLRVYVAWYGQQSRQHHLDPDDFLKEIKMVNASKCHIQRCTIREFWAKVPHDIRAKCQQERDWQVFDDVLQWS